MVKPVQLRKMKLAGLFTPRYAKPVTTGLGYLYFFPLGQTEPSIVHVSDEEAAKTQVPAGRLGTVEEYGAVAAFLCSERAAYVTGSALPVDGGLLQSV